MARPVYPDQRFLRAAVEAHLANFEREQVAGADLVCFDGDSGVRWVIEIKGESGSPEAELRAGLGNLVTQIGAGPKANYVLAMPDIPAYTRERESVPDWALKVLNLWWFIVDETGEVSAIPPDGPVVDAQQLREETARETARAEMPSRG